MPTYTLWDEEETDEADVIDLDEQYEELLEEYYAEMRQYLP